MQLIAKRRGITIKDIEDELLEQATDEVALREIEDISDTLRKKKILDANNYETSDQEIEDILDEELLKNNKGK